jgi:DNA (cytosine-5)-methyltransferase 1
VAFKRKLRALGSADVVLGGFPCQGFSKAGPKALDDSRNTLYREMRRAVQALQPRVFVAENVDGLSQNFGGFYLRRIAEDFAELGYRVEHRVLDAAAYGLPQHRRRLFFVGVAARVDVPPFEWPDRTHAVSHRNGESPTHKDLPLFSSSSSANPSDAPVTIGQAIGDIVELGSKPDHEILPTWPAKYNHIFKAMGPGQKLCNVRHASTSVYTWEIPEAFGTTSSSERLVLETIARNRRHKRYGSIPNGNPLPAREIARLCGLRSVGREIASLLSKNYLKQKGSGYDLKGAMFCSGLFKRPEWDAPAPTVLTNFYNPRYFLHPSEDRPFSLRECARLQGFPDTFEFLPADPSISLVDGYRLVGNAVPPPLAGVIAGSVLDLFSRSGELPAVADEAS